MTAPLAGLRWGLGPGWLLRLKRCRRSAPWDLGIRSSASGKELLGLFSLNNDILLQSCRNYQAVLCTELTKPLIIRNLPSPSLQPHEVRVGVRYCGVNFADILACKGLYQTKHCLPFTPGMEFSGMVMETGANVSTVQEMLWPIPEGVSYEEAAALPVSYGTAILALDHRARTQPGETVLVTAAAGATGLAAIDVAANVLKAKVIAAAGSDYKCNLALQKGAAHSVNYTQGSLKEGVKKLTDNRGVNVVLDAVGGDIFKEALHSLAWEGRIVVVGFAGGAIPSVPANLLLLKNVSALGVFWGRYREEDFPVFSSSLSSALWYCQERRIQPHVGAVFKLEEVNEAFSRVTQRKSTGKVVISMK
ncbi:quinone oxidoreductase-like protein 2 isoform X3 [Chelonia mydas]|uniref:quinone oxidoreductase-like protein 2 isoform X3 n=1 Tax=Chelonia mydas TaxID=8469 RepID=UPI001CA93403|nr:quinone oxidoreductase-like protein 2 isoform X3 [Chelonia mydas]